MMSAETSDPTAESSKVLFTHRFGSDSTETEFKSSIYSTHSALVTTFTNTRLARVPKKTTLHGSHTHTRPEPYLINNLSASRPS
jgi:hypothetical protein